MEKSFQAAVNGIEPSKLEDLVLDNAKSVDGKVSGLPDDLENLESLSLINCSLTSLEGLPKLPKLKRLDVSDNPISTSLDIIAKQCPELGALVLNNCQFADLGAFVALKESTIETLDLDGNEVVNNEAYRNEIFKTIPTLKFLDGINQEGECLDDSDFDDEEGEDFGDSEGDEDGPGLSFFQNSELVDDEDETEDYDPETKKRRHESADDDESNDEPVAKK